MTWIRAQVTPHLLDPVETRKAAKIYASRFSKAELAKIAAEHRRAIEHEQAILAGIEDAEAAQ